MVKADPFYTSAQSMWEMPPHLAAIYAEAAVVILKGDANYRRLLGDLHWPRGCMSFMGKWRLQLEVEQALQRHRPKDWLTAGYFGQILAYSK